MGVPFHRRDGDRNRQECPSCGFDEEYTFERKELVSLFLPETDGEYNRCGVASSIRVSVCRKCGFKMGLDEVEEESK